ncbi:hypothetical protein Hanom_Chr12g01126601 [Helianthus anomalus]
MDQGCWREGLPVWVWLAGAPIGAGNCKWVLGLGPLGLGPRPTSPNLTF